MFPMSFQPHIFSQPGFVLEVPKSLLTDTHCFTQTASSSPPSLTPEALLELQSSIYDVLSLNLRRKLHHMYIPHPSASAAAFPLPLYCSLAANPVSLLHTTREICRCGPESAGSLFTRPPFTRGCGANASTAHKEESNSIPPPFAGIVFVSESPALPVSLLMEDEPQKAEDIAATSTTSPESVSTSQLGFVVNTLCGEYSRGEGAAFHPTCTAEEEATVRERFESHAYRVLYLTDSRVAGEMLLVCLRGGCLALPNGMRLYALHRSPARGAPAASATIAGSGGKLERLPRTDPREMLRKREVLSSRWNLDADLYDALVTGWDTAAKEFEKAWNDAQGALAQRYASGRQGGGGSLTASLLSPAAVRECLHRSTLHFAEAKVRYGSVLDDEELASPFLLVMGLLMASLFTPAALRDRFRLSLPVFNASSSSSDSPVVDGLSWSFEDITKMFLRHPRRRVLHLVALYVARYVVAPEELPFFFFIALGEEGRVSTDPAAPAGSPLSTIAQELLEKDDVQEAWLPAVHPLWRKHLLDPAVAGLKRFWTSTKRSFWQAELSRPVAEASDISPEGVPSSAGPSLVAFALRHAFGTEEDAGNGAAADAHRVSSEGTTHGGLAGTGRGGIGRFGFRSVTELARHVQENCKRVQPKSITRLLASRYGESLLDTQHPTEGSDADLEDVEDTGFLINVAVEDPLGGDAGGSHLSSLPLSARTEKQAESTKAGSKRHREGAAASTGERQKIEASVEEAVSPVAVLQQEIQKEGYRLMLSLLGRRTPFDPLEPHAMEF